MDPVGRSLPQVVQQIQLPEEKEFVELCQTITLLAQEGLRKTELQSLQGQLQKGWNQRINVGRVSQECVQAVREASQALGLTEIHKVAQSLDERAKKVAQQRFPSGGGREIPPQRHVDPIAARARSPESPSGARAGAASMRVPEERATARSSPPTIIERSDETAYTNAELRVLQKCGEFLEGSTQYKIKELNRAWTEL